MRHRLLFSAALLVLVTSSLRAHADTFAFSFAGPGVSGTAFVTYGTATDGRYSQALEVTGIAGNFTDTNLGIVDASITGLQGLNRSAPEPTNLLAPADFSRFPVAVGTQHGSLNYDNLFWPGGSPQTATDYPFGGGFTDIYGLLFDISNGDVVNFWSNGLTPGATEPDYGVAVATSAISLDYVSGGVSVTPEPGTFCLLGTGLLGGALVWRRFC